MKRTATPRRRNVCRTVVGALLAGALQAGVPTAVAQTGAPAQAQLEQRLLDGTGGRGRIEHNRASGRVRLFGTEATHVLPKAPGVPANASPEAAARGFLASFGTLFGVDDQARQLQVRRTAVADQGRANVRFQQVHGGVPVLAGELAVNLDGDRNVLSANGELSAGLDLDTRPAITAAAARTIALEAIAKVAGVEPGQLDATEPALWVFDPVLIGPHEGPPSLVWRTEVTPAASDGEPLRELVLVDAATGALALHFDQIAHARTRRVCDRNNSTSGAEECTAPYTRSEGQAATGIAEVDNAYTFSGNVYDYFSANFGRDSLDGAGHPVVSTVRYCEPDEPCPYNNAFWNGSQIVFGQGLVFDDIVGHEFVHGLTQHEANLLYYYQSGAINESLSDVFGELIDFGNGLGIDTPDARWQLGEGRALGVIRDLENPRRSGIPTPWTARSTGRRTATPVASTPTAASTTRPPSS